jgi:AbrB family looped-hinge helix DNA binding protein
MTAIVKTLGDGGRVVVPAQYRKALGLKTGDQVMLVLEEGEVWLFTPARATERARALVRRYVPAEKSLTDELLAERREEAARG